MTYDAIIFDNDGVLVELVEIEILQRAAVEAFAELGVDDPDRTHVEAMAVAVTPEKLTSVCEVYDFDPETFFATRDRCSSHAQQAAIRDGRKPLYGDFETVRTLDASLGIVSSNQQTTIDYILEHFGIGSLFQTAYGREPTVESIRRKKPNPHYLERAIDDLDASRPLFVGDSDVDVLAAENAGVDSVFLRRSHRTDHRLDVDPTYELDGLTELGSVPGVPVKPNVTGGLPTLERPAADTGASEPESTDSRREPTDWPPKYHD
ncbi:MAG: HAD family hydrolase [Halobacteriota archaeon]